MMKHFIAKYLSWLLIVCLFHLTTTVAKGQTYVNIKVNGINQVGEKIELFYDIEYAAPNETFTVWVEAFRADDKPIKSEQKGDVGDHISGGVGKKVILSFPDQVKRQSIPMYFKVLATSNNKIKYFTKERKLAILKSAILPGWSQYRPSNKTPYWILGLGAYGALGGSIYLNRKAADNYNAYLTNDVISEKRSLLNRSVVQKRTSEWLAISSGAAWLGTMAWTMLQKMPVEESPMLSLKPTLNMPGIHLVMKLE